MLITSATKRHRVFMAGFLSSLAAAGLVILISAYAAPVITFGVTAVLASSMPFLIVVFLAIRERRVRRLSWSEMLGLFLALPSLLLSIFFIRATILLWIGMRHEAAYNIPAPTFQARDLNGKNHRLADHKGEVVLVNVWARWCGYCLAEMPKLDQLYEEHKNQGLIVFGLSQEDPTTQGKGLAKVPVTYPLLTYDGQIPGLYRYVAGYPTTFVIDRQGILQPAIGGDQSLEKLDKAIVALLNGAPSAQ